MPRITLSDHRLAMRLGLGPLTKRPVCHGFVNCCECESCMAIVDHADTCGFTPDGNLAPLPAPAQPWEVRAA